MGLVHRLAFAYTVDLFLFLDIFIYVCVRACVRGYIYLSVGLSRTRARGCFHPVNTVDEGTSRFVSSRLSSRRAASPRPVFSRLLPSPTVSIRLISTRGTSGSSSSSTTSDERASSAATISRAHSLATTKTRTTTGTIRPAVDAVDALSRYTPYQSYTRALDSTPRSRVNNPEKTLPARRRYVRHSASPPLCFQSLLFSTLFFRSILYSPRLLFLFSCNLLLKSRDTPAPIETVSREVQNVLTSVQEKK